MIKNKYILMLGIAAFCAVAVFAALKNKPGVHSSVAKNEAGENQSIKKNYNEDFTGYRTIEETGNPNEPGDKTWWLNSGGIFFIKDGIASTIQGDLAKNNKWYREYKSSNPEDTDNGLHPQNIFRLVLRSSWQNLEQICYFRINKINMSASDNRNQSNGVLLFNRYEDGDTLYYTGLRVDGNAIIKKKYHGTYYTMASKSVLEGGYNKKNSPNLIPQERWLGLKSKVTNNIDGKVHLELYLDMSGNGGWQKVLEAVDDGETYGGAQIKTAGRAGVRTDFMDVDFRDYSISELN